MKQLNFLLPLFLLLGVTTLDAQEPVRYLDEVFTEVNKESSIIYATNISVLSGEPEAIDLAMDVYTPANDDETERPVVVYMHTGSFLPQYFNGQVSGGLQDSTLVEICSRLARMGYTVVAATYRQGWLPGSDDQNTRTETLLQAVYRGVHDTRACIRYLRKTVAEDDNPYGIDTDRIVVWGQGTGGYLAYASAYLDRYEEVLVNKFINTQTAQPYVIEDVHGDVYGLNETPLNIPNWTEYSSDFHLSVNMGGACGENSWIEGADSPVFEPPSIGFHHVTDPFGPFGDGPVIVPTTDEFVVNVSGTRTAIGRANELGVNDVLDPVLGIGDPLTNYVADLEDIPVNPMLLALLGQDPTTHSTPHMYPFLSAIDPGTGFLRFEGSSWEWWDLPTLTAVIAGINAAIPGANLDAMELHEDGLLTNPDMSAENARAYIDTIMAYYAPRACFALDLEECKNFVLSTHDLVTAEQVGFQLSPNPASERAFLQSAPEAPMIDVQLFDLAGRLLQYHTNVEDHTFEIDRSQLPPGMYVLKIRFEAGTLTDKLIFK